jgi:uncharacterized protein (TIGR03118 family)
MKASLGIASILFGLLATSAIAAPIKLDDAQLSQVVAGHGFEPNNFTIVNEVSDEASVGARTTDPLLVNSWGLALAPAGNLWVADNGSGMSTIYAPGTFAKSPLNVSVPGDPTGTVFTSLAGTGFQVMEAGKSGHGLFLFDGEGGIISGWAPSVDLTHAVVAVDYSGKGAVFKGLAIANDDASQQLFAADFARNRVEVFNDKFQQTGAFTDPSLPAGYAPFNVQTLNGKVYVTFALHGQGLDEQHGAGLGFVDVFDTDGHKLQTLVSNGPLNAPWGLAIAPASFKKIAGALLVGNFGDGKINAFDPKTGAFLGALNSDGHPMSIDGLWALTNGPDGTLIFSSGPDDEHHGLVGVVKPRWAAASWAFQSHVKMGH